MKIQCDNRVNDKRNYIDKIFSPNSSLEKSGLSFTKLQTFPRETPEFSVEKSRVFQTSIIKQLNS